MSKQEVSGMPASWCGSVPEGLSRACRANPLSKASISAGLFVRRARGPARKPARRQIPNGKYFGTPPDRDVTVLEYDAGPRGRDVGSEAKSAMPERVTGTDVLYRQVNRNRPDSMTRFAAIRRRRPG